MKKIKLATLGVILGVSLMSSLTTLAGVMFETTLTGTSSTSSYVHLGSGGRYITSSGKNRVATASAKKVVPYFPDSTVASINVRAGEWSQKYFDAQAYTGSGEGQSYYISWSSSYNDASGVVRFQN